MKQDSAPSLRPRVSAASSSPLIDMASKYPCFSFLKEQKGKPFRYDAAQLLDKKFRIPPVPFSFWTLEIMKRLGIEAVVEPVTPNNTPSLKEEKARSPKKENSFHFTKEQLEDIYRSSIEIVSLTESEDILVFLGRSPLWLAETLKTLNVERKMFTVVFSGRPYCQESCIPSAVQKESFFKYMRSMGLTEEKIIMCKGNIVIITRISDKGVLKTRSNR